MIYDFSSGNVSEPYAKLLSEERPITISQGRAQILDDGGVFVEETDSGRLMRFSSQGLMWSMVNDYDYDAIGVLNWSKYIPKIGVGTALLSILEKQCR
jgi:hypothetical protein